MRLFARRNEDSVRSVRYVRWTRCPHRAAIHLHAHRQVPIAPKPSENAISLCGGCGAVRTPRPTAQRTTRDTLQFLGNVAKLGTEQLVGADVLIGPQRRKNVHCVVLAFRRDRDIPPYRCDRLSPTLRQYQFLFTRTADSDATSGLTGTEKFDTLFRYEWGTV